MKDLHGLKWYPAAWLGAINTIIAGVVAFGFLSQTQAAYTTTIATGLTGLVTWFTIRPLDLVVFTAGVSTVITAIGGFGFNLTDQKVAALAAVLTLLANGIAHLAGVPVAGSPSAQDPKLHALVGGSS